MKTIFAVVLLLLVGCAEVYHYDTEGVTAYGETFDRGGEPLYYSLSIDLEKGNRDIATLLVLKFVAADAPIVLGELTPEIVARHLPAWEPPPQWPDIVKQQERERLKAYQVYSGDGAYLSFRNGRLAYLGLCSHCEGRRFRTPRIGRAGSETTYPLPLTEHQLRELFGAPVRLKRQREIYY